MANFKFDNRGLNKIVNQVTSDAAAKAQAEFDSIQPSCVGRPLDEVKPLVRQALDRVGWKYDSDDVDRYAAVLVEGERIEFQPKLR